MPLAPLKQPVLSLALLVVLVAGVGWGAGCGGQEDSIDGGPARGGVDELHRSYAGVRLGDRRSMLRQRLGAPVWTKDEDTPMTYGLAPNTMVADTPLTYAYRDAEFNFVRRRVAGILVYGDGAKTRAGVGIGDSLGKARAAYGKRLRCDDESDGGEYGPIAARCSKPLGRDAYLFFSGDPIEVIVVSRRPFTP